MLGGHPQHFPLNLKPGVNDQSLVSSTRVPISSAPLNVSVSTVVPHDNTYPCCIDTAGKGELERVT